MGKDLSRGLSGRQELELREVREEEQRGTMTKNVTEPRVWVRHIEGYIWGNQKYKDSGLSMIIYFAPFKTPTK